MRKWKCVKSNSIYFTIGRIYETDENGDGLTDDSNSGRRWTNPWRFKLGGFNGASFEEVFNKVKEEEKKVNKFKVGDVVEIKDGNDIENYTAGWSYKMRGNIGKKAKISSIEERDGMPCYRLCDFNYEKYTQSCVYDERGLELVEYPKTKTITITTSDSTTTLTDGTHTTSINRYYADKHDERVAVNTVIDKYYDESGEIEREKNTPKVGDKVKVSNFDKLYPNYRDWLITNNVSIRTALKWENNNRLFTQTKYKVVAIHPHGTKNERLLALIEGENEAFIIGIEGLKVIK